jgi:hypothetical protein
MAGKVSLLRSGSSMWVEGAGGALHASLVRA